MVKRIKKRISRTEEDQTGEQTESFASEQERSLSDELGALGEDRFTESIAQGFKVVVDNSKLITVVAGVVIVGAIGLYIAQSSKTNAVAGASEGFQTGAAAYAEATAAPAPQGANAEADEKPLTAAEQKSRLEAATRDFKTTVAENTGKPIAALATLGEAGSLVALGQRAEALPKIEKVLADASVTPMVRAVALQRQAALLESKGDASGALAAWQRLGKANAAFGLMAGVQEARLLESMGKKTEALKRYEAIKKAHGADLDKLTNRDLKSQVERGLLRLGA